jgi:hypothetical protein
MNKHLIIIAAVFLILGFQNCSNTASFDADGALVAKTDVSLQVDGSNTYDGVIDEIADEMPVSNPPSTGGGGAVLVPTPTPAPKYGGGRDDDDDDYEDDDRDYDDDDRDYDDDDRDYTGRDDDDDDSDDHSNSKTAASYVCVLESSSGGKNVRLGHTAGGLSNDQSAVNDVCMSEKACLETVSKAFAVKGAEKRGYCKESNKSDNFVQMSDKEVEDAIAKEMLKRIMSSN